MNTVIQIHYKTIEYQNKVLQRGMFPLKGKNPEKVAFEWWNKIKREMTVSCELEIVIADGEDITEKVKELEKKPQLD